jgi:hypothetical protein
MELIGTELGKEHGSVPLGSKLGSRQWTELDERPGKGSTLWATLCAPLAPRLGTELSEALRTTPFGPAFGSEYFTIFLVQSSAYFVRLI